VINLRAKFDVSSSNRSRDMEASQNLKKVVRVMQTSGEQQVLGSVDSSLTIRCIVEYLHRLTTHKLNTSRLPCNQSAWQHIALPRKRSSDDAKKNQTQQNETDALKLENEPVGKRARANNTLTSSNQVAPGARSTSLRQSSAAPLYSKTTITTEQR